jgi:hypothetical protein
MIAMATINLNNARSAHIVLLTVASPKGIRCGPCIKPFSLPVDGRVVPEGGEVRFAAFFGAMRRRTDLPGACVAQSERAPVCTGALSFVT